MSAASPVRVLHVIACFERGGIENWLVDLARRIDATRVRQDFLVQTREIGELEPLIAGLGLAIHRCPDPSRVWRYTRALARLLREQGPYDIVHCHLGTWSGIVLPVAARCGVRHRIAHSHSQDSPVHDTHPRVWPLYAALMKRRIARYATAEVAASAAASDALFPRPPRAGVRRQVLPCGIDLERFAVAADSRAVRAEFGIPADVPVIGHVGRFVRPKHHAFLIEVARTLFRLAPAARLLLVGDGPLRPEIEDAARPFGDRVLFTGKRDDVPRILRAMDVFVFPSRDEGLGLAAVEAQAAGLPIVVADHLPRELEVVPELVRWTSLSEPAENWARVIEAALEAPAGLEPGDALAVVRRSPFDLETCVRDLVALYEHLLTAGPAAGPASG